MDQTTESARKKHHYRLSACQRQAEEIRRRILAATRDLFASRGRIGRKEQWEQNQKI